MATQIIIECLPISSSSHVRLVELLLAKFNYPLLDFPKHAADLLNIATLGVIAIFFFKRWSILLLHMYRNIYLVFEIGARTCISAFITTIIYFIFQIIDVSFFPMSIGLCITALILFSSYYCPTNNYQKPTITTSIILGIVQGIALLPGISRLASTVVVGRWLRLSPRHALETSFAIETPLMIAAFVRACIYLFKSSAQDLFFNPATISVMLFCSVIAYGCLWITWYCVHYNYLWVFAYYLVVPIIISLII